MQLKFVMALTGAVMLAYLVVHMLGNLKIFFGEQALNTYASWLREVGEPALPGEGMLWIIRVVLLVSVVAHIVAATILARRARAARPVKYAHRRPVTTSYASRTMRWGGVIIALFIVYHILDLTTGTLNPNGQHGEEARREDHGEHQRDRLVAHLVGPAGPTEGLQRAPDAVPQVESQRDHRDGVGERDVPPGEVGHDVVVDLAGHPVRVQRPGREIEDVIDCLLYTSDAADEL